MSSNIPYSTVAQRLLKNDYPTVAVIGHICLDVIPSLIEGATRIEPGHLYLAGPVACSTGGVVSNTGLALHRLGVAVRLIGMIGDDLFGQAILNLMRDLRPSLADGFKIQSGAHTSYSIVISPPGADRSFLHCPGANDTFRPSDIDLASLQGVRMIHFGYPPLMEQVYADGGRELANVFKMARSMGIATSLDMSMPDPCSPAGAVDWCDWLARVLPHVDYYLPSLEETEFMLRRPSPRRMEPATADVSVCKQNASIAPDHLRSLADELLGFGATIVVLKLGEHGLYLKSADRNIQVSSSDWRRCEMLAPCFQVDAVGTTGAGDSTIAGFLAAVLDGAQPSDALVQAVAVGACCVEAHDALSGIRSLAEITQRVKAGWGRRMETSPGTTWRWVADPGVWIGPYDTTTAPKIPIID